uniref:procollagen-proline 4-dioxygenase n=1 Tax=Oryza rufipogon TaxID=4529 RepID=A0A0E0R0Y2_ORYRU
MAGSRAAGRGGRPLLGGGGGKRGSGGGGGGGGGGKSSSYTTTVILAALLLASVALLLLVALGALSLPSGGGVGVGHAGIGLPRPRPRFRRSAAFESGLEMRGGEKGEPWTEVLSWEPRAFLYHNFLSKEECEYLISLAKPHMKKSTVVDASTGGSKDSRVRTSSGMFLGRGQDKIIRTIEKRISDYTFIPVENGEGLQVLHYEVGQKYEPHFDYFHDEFNTKNGGQRIATLLISDVEEGGETIFPSSKANSSSSPFYNELSECAKKGLAVKPKMGDALLFWSMRPDGSLDATSLHGGCPVIKGNKWSSTKWMRVTHEFKFVDVVA